MSDLRPSLRRAGLPTGRLPGVAAALIVWGVPALLPLAAGGKNEEATGRISVLAGAGPWNESPVAPGRSNYRLVIEYSAAAGVNAVVSLQGWKRWLPAGEKTRAEFAIEDADGSPYIVRHWRPGRDLPDSTERPRGPDDAAGPEVTLTAPEGFTIHRAFVEALRESDHGELWAKISAADAGIGAALYRDHCRACHGEGENAGRYPGLSAWNDRAAGLSSDPFALWRAFNEPTGQSVGHPHLTDEEAYHVVRYLRERLLPPAAPGETAPELPRGRVLASPPEKGGDSGAPWRRMDHGPFLFHALSITDGEGEAILEIERALVVRLDPGIGGVTRGRVRAIYDVGKFRFLGIARGGNFSDAAAIFDGNGPPRLTLAGATFQAAEEPEGDAGAAEFKGVRVSGREVIVLSSLHGVDFAERFVWKEDQGPERVYGPLENDAASGKPAPADLVESVTRVVAEEAESGVPLMIEAIPAPAPDEIITASWMRFTGLAARGDGTAFLCTPNGEVWMVRGLDGADPAPRWRRFASGLDTPHQLAITGGVLAARCRGGWFRLSDRDNDGFCEFYEPEPAPERDAVALRTDQLARFAAPARTGDNTWYFAVAATETSPGAGLIRSQGGPPSEADPPVYVWLPGAESSPPAGPVWLPATSKWGGGFQGGTLWPCRDSGGVFRLWSARPGDLSMPRVLWSLPVPPLETDITGSSFAGSSLYFCGLPLDEETPAHTTSFWRLRRLKGHLFHPVEFDADDQSVTLRFNAPLDAAATAASRFVRVTGWKPDARLSEAKPISPRRVLLGRNTLRVVSDAIEAGAGFTLECAVTDMQGLSHRFTVHFTLPDELPPAVLPAPRSRPMPPPIAAGEDGETPPPQDPVDNPLLDDGPAFEWPGRLPELDDPVEEEEPLPRR